MMKSRSKDSKNPIHVARISVSIPAKASSRRMSRGASGSVSISVGEGGSRVRLKPGEALDRGNGEVRDIIGDGEIQVRRRPSGQ